MELSNRIEQLEKELAEFVVEKIRTEAELRSFSKPFERGGGIIIIYYRI